MFVSCRLIMGSSKVERWLSLAQYGIQAEICPSSWHYYLSIYVANDVRGCCVRPWWNLPIILSPDIHHEECAFIRSIQGAPSRFSSLRFTSVGVFPDLLRILIRNSSRTVAFSCSAPALPCHRCIRYPCSSSACITMV